MANPTNLPVSSYTVPIHFEPNDPSNDEILDDFLGSHVLEFPETTPKEIQERLVLLWILDIEMANT